jgi:cytochrome P450
MRTNVLQVWRKAAYEQDVVVGRGRLTGRLHVIVNTADAIHQVLVGNTANYHRPAAAIRIGRPIVGDGLLLSEGDTWRRQRRAMAPAMAVRVVPMMARHVARATEQAMAQVTQVAANRPVDILATMQLLALQIASRSMFSLEMGRYGAALRRHVTEFSGNLGRPHVLDFILPAAIPSLRDFARRRFRSRWLALIDEIVEARLRTPTAAGKPRDLFDLLLAVRDPQTGVAFSRSCAIRWRR